ncbi:MAG: ABC transporter permease [Candidatus Eisenbacteria bacterium]|nr:ABC transporter permease [Candidatus Eisenbacteria bacterium]
MRPEERAAGGRGRRKSLAGENVRMALGTLWSQKLRSGLTLLGIIIGVATVIAMVSMIQGLNRSMARQIGSLGSGVLYITKHEAGIHIGGMEERKPRKDLTVQDAAAIEELCPAIEAVSAEIWDRRKLAFGAVETKSIGVVGATEDYFLVNNRTVDSGRPITDEDVRHGGAVCILGTAVEDLLFPSGGALGSRIRVGDESAIVIGILNERGKFLGENNDELVLMPLTRLSRKLGYGNSVDYMIAAPKSPAVADAAREQVEELLRRRRGVKSNEENDFGITSQENLLQIYKQVTQGFYLVMILISSIGLMVGGIGVMNMMLVSVKERTREIGLRMAVGCRRRDLMGQFLVEAAVLTGAGGVIGIVVGQALAFGVSLAFPVPAAVSVPWMLIAVAVSASIGLFFGLYPAWRASRLDPVEALRYE